MVRRWKNSGGETKRASHEDNEKRKGKGKGKRRRNERREGIVRERRGEGGEKEEGGEDLP